MSRSRSILLQVAFKEAVSATLGTEKSIEDQTVEFYNLLTSLHDKFGLSLEDNSSSSYRGSSSGSSSRQPTPLPDSVTQFTDKQGTTWNDFRAAKKSGDVVPKHPDFKTTDNKQSEWIFDQEGNEKEDVIALRQAADQMASLTAPM